MVVHLPGKQKLRSSSLAKGYLFHRSVGIPSRCLILGMSHNIKHSHKVISMSPICIIIEYKNLILLLIEGESVKGIKGTKGIKRIKGTRMANRIKRTKKTNSH